MRHGRAARRARLQTDPGPSCCSSYWERLAAASDEFVIALAHSGPTDLVASQLAAHIVARLREPFELGDGIVVEMGVRIGVASFPRHGRHRRKLMRAADEAMYWVKRQGKNAYAAALTEGQAALAAHASSSDVDPGAE